MKRGNSMIKSAEVNPVATSFNRDYVFSLHQNMRSSLLYGKNNVCVSSSEKSDLLKGYLSLHRENTGILSVKWTPNQLMHSRYVLDACRASLFSFEYPLKETKVANENRNLSQISRISDSILGKFVF